MYGQQTHTLRGRHQHIRLSKQALAKTLMEIDWSSVSVFSVTLLTTWKAISGIIVSQACRYFTSREKALLYLLSKRISLSEILKSAFLRRYSIRGLDKSTSSLQVRPFLLFFSDTV
jgi:hypothetical protein